jgi:hypothetical protein
LNDYERDWRAVAAEELLVPHETGTLPWDEPADHGGPVVVLYATGNLIGSTDVQYGYLALDEDRVVGVLAGLMAAAWEVGMDVNQIEARVNMELRRMYVTIMQERRDAQSN